MAIPVTEILLLGRGEARLVRVERGITVLVLAGPIHIHGPLVWLAETALGNRQHLAPEHALTIERSGWVEIHAEAAAQVALIPPLPIPGRGKSCTLVARIQGQLKRWLRPVHRLLPR